MLNVFYTLLLAYVTYLYYLYKGRYLNQIKQMAAIKRKLANNENEAPVFKCDKMNCQFKKGCKYAA